MAIPFLNPNKPSHRAILQAQAQVPEGTDLPMQASKAPRGSRANMSGRQKKQKTSGSNNKDHSLLDKTAGPNPEAMNATSGLGPMIALQDAGAGPGGPGAGFAKGGKVNFIKSAIQKPGQLHRDLGVPEGETIPAAKEAAAAKRKGKVGARARFAEMLRGLKK